MPIPLKDWPQSFAFMDKAAEWHGLITSSHDQSMPFEGSKDLNQNKVFSDQTKLRPGRLIAN
jgi:hypothetical protein